MRRRPQADVELTPLIDVLFILIIFFVLTASFVQGQIPVDLPDGRGNPPEEKGITVTISHDGTIYWDDSPVEKDELIVIAKEAIAAGRSLILTADRSIPYGDVATLLDRMRENGITTIGLGLKGTEP
ncbi:biopolymer transporter ExbD [Dethiosulfovibrio sp. F2B]|uniref:ExbD/TolR family protein n=1 Tax=Dethiosulfovibrio faecalis TaxID=2720018 RepID=UPI001F31CE42|nr:biopolymer transporter ExbD [Dethiosulfovibrio faecalis]